MIWLIGALLALLGSVAPRRQVMEIRGMAFHPSALRVASGDTVVWINRDLVAHNASGAGGAPWTTGLLLPGDSGRYLVGAEGEIRFFCSLHPTMRGSLKNGH